MKLVMLLSFLCLLCIHLLDLIDKDKNLGIRYGRGFNLYASIHYWYNGIDIIYDICEHDETSTENCKYLRFYSKLDY